MEIGILLKMSSKNQDLFTTKSESSRHRKRGLTDVVIGLTKKRKYSEIGLLLKISSKNQDLFTTESETSRHRVVSGRKEMV